jgi:glycine hydroxymethyltransferase
VIGYRQIVNVFASIRDRGGTLWRRSSGVETLTQGGVLACGIGLPIDPVEGDMNGRRFGTPEWVRRGMSVVDMQPLAALIARALASDAPIAIAEKVMAFRQKFQGFRYIGDYG